MSIQVYTGWDLQLNRQVFQIIAFGKSKPTQIGKTWLGRRVAVRAFGQAIRLQCRNDE